MDKIRLYRILDIDSADEFQYFENLSALLEEDEPINSPIDQPINQPINRTEAKTKTYKKKYKRKE